MPGAAIAFVLDHNASESEHEATLRHGAMFEVNLDRPATFGGAMSDFALPLRSLLSFLTLGDVGIDSLAVTLERRQDDGLKIWFDFRTRLQCPFENPKLPRRHETETITYLLLPHHAPYLYTDDHLMTAFVAAEAYHKARFNEAVLGPADFQQRVDAIVAAAPDELRGWAREKRLYAMKRGAG